MNGANLPAGSRGGLGFLGRMTANLSHELNNVFTIIGEVAGLLDDLVVLHEKGRPLGVEKLRSLSENIKRQLERGRTIVKNMNYLGHSTDGPAAQVDLNALIESLAGLGKRIAERKGAALETVTAAGPVVLACDPFALMRALFLCVDAALEGGAVGSPVRIFVRRSAAGTEIGVESDEFDPAGAAKEPLEEAGLLAAGLPAEFASGCDGNGHRISTLGFNGEVA